MAQTEAVLQVNPHAGSHLPGGGDTIPDVTAVQSGLMAAADKVKLDGLISGDFLEANTLCVDLVTGNNGTAIRGDSSKPYATLAAALAAAVSGDLVHLRAGTYILPGGFVIPAGVAIRGAAVKVVTLQLTTALAATLVTMGENSRLEDISLLLLSSSHVTLIGVLFPGTTSATAKMRVQTITVDNSTAGAGASNVTGVLVQSSGAADRSVSAIRAVTVTVKSTGSGAKRGILMDTVAGMFHARDTNVRVQNIGGGAGSFVGIEMNIAGGLQTFLGGTVQGDTADVIETAGRVEVSGTVLVTATTLQSDYIPDPETRVTGNSSRVTQTTFDGTSYKLIRRLTLNALAFRLTAFTAPGTLRILVYQAAGGASGGMTRLIGSIVAFAPGGSGNQSVVFSEGDIFLEPGVFFVLYGRDSATGAATMRTYIVSTLDLINTNMDVATHATSFTTAIAANTTPATFDPRESPTGSAVSTILDIPPIIRCKKV